MNSDNLFERTGLFVAAGIGLFSLILFYFDTQMFFGSVFAALIAAGLGWLTYLVIRLLMITFKK